ncbi:MAG: hypothetical protein LBU65_06320, partial [Planctomycetaceae bacterium]|nr:hypothetical protein [Planctomycetaceae bacterium]
MRYVFSWELYATISQGNPPVSDVPCFKENITTQFAISLVEKVDNREEDASKKTTSQIYTVTVGGEQLTIKKFEKGSFTIANDKLSATRNNGMFMTAVTPIVLAKVPGDKTVILSVSITMKDGTTLSTSETITFTVPDFYFAVFVLDGKP